MKQSMQNPLDRGAFLVSIDTEMAWGTVHHRDGSPHYTYQQEREFIHNLLGLLERYQIRATWAVVGHLFLDRCQPENGRKHPEILRPAYSWLKGDWFDPDPCTDAQRDPMWYGRDLVESIRSCQAPQEIGSHAFSHLIVGDPQCSAESFSSDLQACRQAAKRMGIQLKSFVFPRNQLGHFEVLADHGFTSYRGLTPPRFGSGPKPVRMARRVLSEMGVLPAAPVLPQYRHSMWDVPATYFYGSSATHWRLLPIGVMAQRVRRDLSRAAQQRGLVHLWFHPHNLTAHPDRSLKGLEIIFRKVHQLRQQGTLDNPTMGELAESLQRKALASPPA